MKNAGRYLIIAILISLTLGQLTRIAITPRAAFYFHDVLIGLYLMLHFRLLFDTLIPILYHKRSLLSSVIVLGWLLLGLWLNQALTLIPVAYLVRLATYSLFFLVAVRADEYTDEEWLAIMTSFFAVFALTGIGQYLLAPDARVLEFLGWDDHYYRLIGTWLDPAFTGLGLLLGLIFTANAARHTSSLKEKKVLRLTFTGCFIALILTYSRASYLAAGVVLLLIAARRPARFSLINAKKVVIGLGLAALILVFLALTAYLFPSDSTNLLRTNSIRIRAEMITSQLQGWQWWQWWTGRGAFVALPGETNELRAAGYKQTAAFPDNVFILWLSFFGLPVTIGLLYYGVCWLGNLYRRESVWFYYLIAVMIHAQFNQSFFQPFIVLLLGFLWLATQEKRSGKLFC